MAANKRQIVRSETPRLAASCLTISVTSPRSGPFDTPLMLRNVSDGPIGLRMTSPADSNRDRAEARRLVDPASLSIHPQAKQVPGMEAAAFRCFCADIEQRGIQLPLELTAQALVLDGRERLRAALLLRLEQVPTRIVEPEDELEYMLLAALERRQLSASQRAALSVELDQYRQLRASAEERQRANLRQNRVEGATLPPRGKSRDQAAARTAVSGRTIQDALTVQTNDPELFEQVRQGRLPVHRAARRIRRRLRDQNLPAAPALPEGPFGLVYADPPWQLGDPDSATAPDKHYPTMPLSEIKELQVPAAKDAILFLWAVNCLLPQALQVMSAWGFECRTNLVWVKPSIGLGRWARNRHELLLVGVRGSFPSPEPEDCPDSVIEAARGRHSEKPLAFYELIERMYPLQSKLELFARSSRPGWTAWGNEAPQ